MENSKEGVGKIIEINFSSYDFDSPLQRRAALLKIPPDRAVVRKYHAELLELFRREMAYRRADDSAESEGESDCFEQIYWCGLLLYLVGDPADVPLMWEGKRIDMDTAIGFDGQFLVGAGVEQTIKYLEEHGQRDPAEYLKGLKASKELDDLQGWVKIQNPLLLPRQPVAGKRQRVDVIVRRESRWTSAGATHSPATGSLHPMASEVGCFSVTKSPVWISLRPQPSGTSSFAGGERGL